MEKLWGLLVPQGAKRGRHYTASEALRAIGAAAAQGEVRQFADPFEMGQAPPSAWAVGEGDAAPYA